MAQHGTILIASGASGGHIFPALAMAEELKRMHYDCVFVIGGRKFTHLVSERGFRVVRLPAAAFANRGPLALAWAVFKLGLAFLWALLLVVWYRPAVAVGTGGYGAVATLLAAKVLRVPSVIHEQNMIFGRANRLLCRVVNKVLVTFPQTQAPSNCPPMTVVGTPLRQEIMAARQRTREEDGTFRLLVVGGSQGSGVLGDVIPAMLCLFSAAERARFVVVHQARANDVEALHATYKELGLAGYKVEAFFSDMPRRYVDAHLVISRGGMNTLLEVAAMGRAVIAVPHMLADNHQRHNVQVFEEAGAAILLPQDNLNAKTLHLEVNALLADKERLETMEKAAVRLAPADAAQKAAREVVALAR